MSYYNGPCWSCIEKTCKNCPCAVAEAYENTYLDAQWMQKLSWNKDDCDKFVERLWKENTDFTWVGNEHGELVLDQNWRGFPVGSFTQDDWFRWVDEFHSKGVDWVYKNVSV
ncbi:MULTISPECIES: hypothetical protein [Faecalibacterium]|uniref:hypothetical protein n=1 Tax=Faecalibacterium TaxID=216851 RepID=UPI0011C22DB6|nr:MULTISPECIES: hypothetical protein [Faecalibacterium]